MAVVRLPDGTYQVGGMTFATADEAFAHDARPRAPAAAAPPAALTPRSTGDQSRMTTKSKLAVLAVAVVAAFLVWGQIQVWLAKRNDPANAAAAARGASEKKAAEAVAQRKAEAEAEARRVALVEKCTTGAPAVVAEAKKLLVSGDLTAAASALAPCHGLPMEAPASQALWKQIDAARDAKIAQAARDEKARKKREGVSVGMSKEDVLASSWGRPEKVNTTTTAHGTREQWVYGGHNYLYFTGNLLTTIQN